MRPMPSATSVAPLLDLATLLAPAQEGTQETVQDPGPDGGEGPTQQAPGLFGGMMVPMLIVFGIFYFVMIGPERKARKKREAMLAEIKKGDHVVTSSGLHGTITNLAEDVVTLQVDEGVRLRFSRGAIQTVVPKDA